MEGDGHSLTAEVAARIFARDGSHWAGISEKEDLERTWGKTMSRSGSYIGGHTVIGPRSGWFSKNKKRVFKKKKTKPAQTPPLAGKIDAAPKILVWRAPPETTEMRIDKLRKLIVQHEGEVRGAERKLKQALERAERAKTELAELLASRK